MQFDLSREKEHVFASIIHQKSAYLTKSKNKKKSRWIRHFFELLEYGF